MKGRGEESLGSGAFGWRKESALLFLCVIDVGTVDSRLPYVLSSASLKFNIWRPKASIIPAQAKAQAASLS